MIDSLQDRGELLEAFRNAMRHVAATVYAVTTRHEGRSYGILATAVSSLSFDPPSLLACINRISSLHTPLLAERRFCVNVLGENNLDVAQQFADPAMPDRFAVGDWQIVEGVPMLASAQSSMVCRLAEIHDFGTHSICIGELLLAAHRQNRVPLTYFNRDYLAQEDRARD